MLPGEGFGSRVGSSMLLSIGLRTLVARTLSDYGMLVSRASIADLVLPGEGFGSRVRSPVIFLAVEWAH